MEARYEDMNKRNIWFMTPPHVNTKIEQARCVAAYALGDWYLQPSIHKLYDRLESIVGDTGCIYKTIPSNAEGLLHQTLLQFIRFDANVNSEDALKAMQCVANILTRTDLALSIRYKGLVWTPTGLALAGYCEDEEKILQVRTEIEEALKSEGLPCSVPYKNDILSATILRWVKQPDTRSTLWLLEKEVVRWSECVLGELRVRQWTVGKGSWRMLEGEREDFFTVPVAKHICHRGNIHGPVKELENNFGVLIQRSLQGYDVELDVWYIKDALWLGHDKPEHRISFQWLVSSKRRLIHAKNGPAFEYLLQESGKRGLDLHIFYHTDEDYILTSKGIVICYPGKPLLKGSMCMMPERAQYTQDEMDNAFSICSDTKP